LKNSVYAAVTLFLATFMGDFQYGLFLGIFTLFYFMYEIFFHKDFLLGFLKRLLIMVMVFLFISSPIIIPLVIAYFSGNYGYASSSLNDWIVFSADLASFFIPPHLNFFFGKYTKDLVKNLGYYEPEGMVYIGYTILILISYAIYRSREESRFWLICSTTFAILSLGPILHVLGNTCFFDMKLKVPLPAFILYYIVPVFRVPARFDVIVTICLAILSAIGLKALKNKFEYLRNYKLFATLLIIIFLGLVIEYNMWPYPIVTDTSIPSFYYELREMNGTFAILDIPLQGFGAINKYMYYSTASEKPLIVGAISRPSYENVLLLRAFPIFIQAKLALEGKNILTPTSGLYQEPNMTNLNAFHFFGVKYVIVHKPYLTSEALEILTCYLNSLLGYPIYSDQYLIAYEVKEQGLKGLFSYLWSGWFFSSYWDDTPTEFMGNIGIIKVIATSEQQVCLSFRAMSLCNNVRMGVYLNGQKLYVFSLSPSSFNNEKLSNLTLKKGENEIVFKLEGELTSEYSSDTILRVAFQNILISSSRL
jgi:hypothetical protein